MCRRHSGLTSRAWTRRFALLIGPVSGLLGAGLGYVGSRRISATEAPAARRTEIRRAVAAYFASLYPLVAELRGREFRTGVWDLRRLCAPFVLLRAAPDQGDKRPELEDMPS